MDFFEIYIRGLIPVLSFFALTWVISVFLKNASIVDIIWGPGFVLIAWFFFLQTGPTTSRETLVLALITLWGIRLAIYLFWRNSGKDEDYRYRDFRNHYGPKRYWWVSFFQVFMLQGLLVWIISAPLLAVMYFSTHNSFNWIDWIALFFWITGFSFEAGGDLQMARFKANPENKGKVLQTGFWKYTRHPNYFGDAMVWWGFALFSIAAGSFLPVLSVVLMTWLLLRVSGVSLLEKTLKHKKPGYIEYVKKTSSFIPWFPKKNAL